MQEIVDRMYDMITELDSKAAEWPPPTGSRKILDQKLDEMVTACLILLGRFRASLHHDNHLDFGLHLFDALSRIAGMTQIVRMDFEQPSTRRTSPIQELVERISDMVSELDSKKESEWPPATGDREILDQNLSDMETSSLMLLSHLRASLHRKWHLPFAISLLEVLSRVTQMVDVVRNSPPVEPSLSSQWQSEPKGALEAKPA